MPLITLDRTNFKGIHLSQKGWRCKASFHLPLNNQITKVSTRPNTEKKEVKARVMSPTTFDFRNRKWMSSLKDTEEYGGMRNGSSCHYIRAIEGDREVQQASKFRKPNES